MSPKPIPCHFVLRSNSQRHPQSISVLCHLWTLPKLGHKKNSTSPVGSFLKWQHNFKAYIFYDSYEGTTISTHIRILTIYSYHEIHKQNSEPSFSSSVCYHGKLPGLHCQADFSESVTPKKELFTLAIKPSISSHFSASFKKFTRASSGKKRSNGRWEVYGIQK